MPMRSLQDVLTDRLGGVVNSAQPVGAPVRAALPQPPGTPSPYQNDFTPPNTTVVPATPPAAAAPALSTKYLGAVDKTKFNDPNFHSAKYDILRVLSGFDPSQGVTPDLLKALNGQGYGTFSGSGQNLSLSNLTDKGKQANFGSLLEDAIGGFQGDHPHWQYGFDGSQQAWNQPQAAPAAGRAGVPAMGMGGGGLSGILTNGLGSDNVRAALGQLASGQNGSLLQQLIASLGGQ